MNSKNNMMIYTKKHVLTLIVNKKSSLVRFFKNLNNLFEYVFLNFKDLKKSIFLYHLYNTFCLQQMGSGARVKI